MNFKISAFILLSLSLTGIFFFIDPASSTQTEEIQWHSYDNGMARGQFEKKKVFLHFTAAWCYYCGVMDKEAFKDPAIIASLNENFIPIKVDYDKEENISRSYRVRGLPDTIFISEDGQIIGRRPGYIPPDQLKRILKSVLKSRSQ